MRRRRPPQAVEPRLSFGSWDELADAPVIVACHPEWRGIRTAAYTFDAPVVEVVDAARPAVRLASAMASAGTKTLVVHGFPPGVEALLREVHDRGIATRLVLHSSMAQHGAEPGESAVADAAARLVGEGVLGRLGFVKEGLAEAFEALGYPAAYVPNRVPRLPSFERVDLGGNALDVGVFAEPFWRKNVVTQLGAVALLGGRAHVLTKPDMAYLAPLPIVEHGTMPWKKFIPLQSSVDLNLYVTLSECQPMTPLESYLAGVPCLTARSSALFRDDPDLWRLTTIGQADNPKAIATAAARLLELADEVVPRAREWMTRWDGMARQRWEDFVG